LTTLAGKLSVIIFVKKTQDMKNLILSMFALSAIFFSSGCSKVCDEFHEGKKCDAEVREKYVGTYYGLAKVDGQYFYNQPISVTKGSEGAKSLFMPGDGIKFDLKNKTEFLINYYVSGIGKVEGDGYFSGSNFYFYSTVTELSGKKYEYTFSGSR
jgi:hypothetical protein